MRTKLDPYLSPDKDILTGFQMTIHIKTFEEALIIYYLMMFTSV